MLFGSTVYFIVKLLRTAHGGCVEYSKIAVQNVSITNTHTRAVLHNLFYYYKTTVNTRVQREPGPGFPSANSLSHGKIVIVI